MRLARTLHRLAMACALLPAAALAAEEGETPSPVESRKPVQRTVTARVTAGGQGVGIHAPKQPAEFTIPEGRAATKLRYSFHDPKTGRRLKKLTASSIYSVTEQRYITEAADNPNLRLPPGKYRFVVGGHPGASGQLSFDMVPGDTVEDGAADGRQAQPNVTCSDVFYVKDGKRAPVHDVDKEHPLKLRYADGRLTGTHEYATRTENNLLMKWKTTIEGTLHDGQLSGTYAQLYTLSDHNAVNYPNGFDCYRRTLTGQLSGQVDTDGRLHVTVSDWTQEVLERPYRGVSGKDIPTRFEPLGGWQHVSKLPPVSFQIGFEISSLPED